MIALEAQPSEPCLCSTLEESERPCIPCSGRMLLARILHGKMNDPRDAGAVAAAVRLGWEILDVADDLFDHEIRTGDPPFDYEILDVAEDLFYQALHHPTLRMERAS
jgi:hypothetical protein